MSRRKEVLQSLRLWYERTRRIYRSQLITEAVELLGYSSQGCDTSIAESLGVIGVPVVMGRPRKHDPEKLLVSLKAIWLAALQPCGKGLVGAMAEWAGGTSTIHSGFPFLVNLIQY